MYLILHIDLDFIAGIVYAGNKRSFPITKNGEDFLWLYFFNDPYNSKVSFSKDYRKHYFNNEVNYYGNIFSAIVDGHNTFQIRAAELPLIELLDKSGLIDDLRNSYYQKVTSDEDHIPTLLTFSNDIGDVAKQMMIEYFIKRSFKIVSFSIPLSELVCYHFWKNGQFSSTSGKYVILLEAINSTLNLTTLSFHDNYFLMNANKCKSYPEKGLDPRRKAIIKYVIETVNRATGFLSTDEAKFEECKRLEQFAEDWLKRLDNTKNNIPLNIQGVSFANSTSIKKDVIINKRNVEEDTGSYIQELIDIFKAFENDFVGDHNVTSAVILFGDCFNNELIKNRFLQTIGSDKLLTFNNNELFNVLSDYPNIDIARYSDEAKRLKALAEAEFEKRKKEKADILKGQLEAEEIAKREEEKKKKEHNKEEAHRLLIKANNLVKEKKYIDAQSNLESALHLDPENAEIKSLSVSVQKEVLKFEIKLESYKTLLSEGEKLVEKEDLQGAIVKFELALTYIESDSLKEKINTIRQDINSLKEQERKQQKLLSIAEKQISDSQFKDAEKTLSEALKMNPNNEEVKLKLIEVNAYLKQATAAFEKLVKEGNILFEKGDIDKSEVKFKKALDLQPNDRHCIEQLNGIVVQREFVLRSQEKYNRAIELANDYFAKEDWQNAKDQLTIALQICPNEKYPSQKINDCERKLNAIEDKFQTLIFDAEGFLKKGKKKEALNKYKEALNNRPSDKELKSKIRTLEFELDDWGNPAVAPKDVVNKIKDSNKDIESNIVKKEEDDFLGVKPKRKSENTDFLNNTEKAEKGNDDFFSKTKEKKPHDDDFFQKPINNQKKDDWNF